jgi:hypothetical protein
MSDVAALISSTTQFNRYTPMPVFVLGFFGNICNMLIFTRRALFSNPCTAYMLSATCVNMNVLFFGLVIRSLMDGFNIDVVGNSIVLCRLRYVMLHPSYALSSWFLVLASIDRFCISSRNTRLRSFSTLSIARWTIVIATVTCLLLYIHILGLFEIEQIKSGPYCYARAGTYRVLYDFLFFASFSFSPPILMMIIGLATVHNIRLARVRVTAPTSVSNNTQTKSSGQLNKKDRQLIIMLLIQLIATIVCTLPHALQKLYTTFTVNDTKSPLRSAIESLISQLTRQLLYINAGISFYL